jgi:hypothetical protein
MSEPHRIFLWDDLVVACFCCFVIGISAGYGWRMYHESLSKPLPTINALYIPDLDREISKGKEFWLQVDKETQLHFFPLRKASYDMAIRREKTNENR